MNQRKRRLYSFVHVIEAIWDCLCMFLHDVFNPVEFLEIGFNGYDHNGTHPTGSASVPRTGVDKTQVAICSRKCPGCHQQLKLEQFFGIYNNTEFLYCIQCRNAGKPHLPFTLWDHPITTTSYQNNTVEYRQNYYNNRYDTESGEVYTFKSNSPDYYEVDIEEASQFWLDPLVYGEHFITWADLSSDSPKVIKSRRRNRMRNRKYAILPWVYSIVPENDFEQDFRDRCERLWRHGFDENLPDGLLTTSQWSRFWTNYENRKTQCV